MNFSSPVLYQPDVRSRPEPMAFGSLRSVLDAVQKPGKSLVRIIDKNHADQGEGTPLFRVMIPSEIEAALKHSRGKSHPVIRSRPLCTR